MSGINSAHLVGRLGKDPEIKYTQAGKAVANFSIATSEVWKDKNTGEKNEVTDWHNIVIWDKLAEVCGEYLKKGSQVYVSGRLKNRSWEDQDGIKRYTTEIIANKMEMLGTKGGSKQDK